MRLCEIQGCGERHVALGFCDMHYRRFKLYGDPQGDIPPRHTNKRYANKGKLCKVEGCFREAERGGCCFGHYQRFQKYGSYQTEKPISVRKGWYKGHDGYIRIPSNGHPNGEANGSILQHIKVMSDRLGRPLEKGETIHHKNGIRDDNRPENLELWVKGRQQPSGQRVSDLIKFAKDIIKQYGEDSCIYE